METKELLVLSRQIWGDKKMDLEGVVVRMGKVLGDICRYGRNEITTDRAGGETGIKKELGNMVFSTIRWCDDLGYEPQNCVDIAIIAQKAYREINVVWPQTGDIKQLLAEARQIWPKKTLGQIIVRMGKVFGDICRYARNDKNTDRISGDDLKKELGNMIFSTICWCDDLGYDPEECVRIAIEAQKEYQKNA
jgi:hypothetical protein